MKTMSEADREQQEIDAEVERTLKMSDDEIWAEAVREHGSPEAALKEAERIRDLIKHITDEHCVKAGRPPLKFFWRSSCREDVREEGRDFEW